MSSMVSLEYLSSVQPSSIGLSRYNSAGTSYAVIIAGTPITFPSESFNNGFTVNAANNTITVLNAGSYQISYRLSATTSVGIGMSSVILANGVALPSLTRSPGIATSEFSASAIVTLAAGTTLQMQLRGLLATVVAQSGAGAVINIVKVA